MITNKPICFSSRRIEGQLSLLLSSTAIGLVAGLLTSQEVQAQEILNLPGTVPSQCTVEGGAAVCDGDLSQGIDADGPPLIDLTIQNLTTAIAPEDGVQGVDVNIAGSGDVTLTIDATPFGINTTNADAIDVLIADNGILTLESSGDITTQGGVNIGIDVEVDDDGDLSLVNNGDISSSGDGIDASVANGTIDITNTGDITSETGLGVDVTFTGGGDATITNNGDIVADDTGIDVEQFNVSAVGDTSSIEVNNIGNIISEDGRGIRADISRDADITIMNQGAIQAFDEGLEVELLGSGTVDISTTGSITSEDGGGIDIFVLKDGEVSITNNGAISASSDGININVSALAPAGAASAVNITSAGDITSEEGVGIDVSVFGDGEIAITNKGAITTFANDAAGIDAVLSGNGPITIDTTGNITTSGDGSSAIFSDISGDGDIMITSIGDLTATGLNSNGIEISNEAPGLNTVNIADSIVSGGSGTGAAINLSDSFGGAGVGTNTINTMGDVVFSSLAGIAVNDAGADTTINNFGTLSTLTDGAIDLGGGANAFNNMAGAVFHAGETIDLGAGNFFTNDGVLSPGGSDAIANTTITGNFVQSATGELLIDVGSSDVISVSGTAALDGNVRVQVESLTTGPQQETIFTANGGATDLGLGLIANPALQASLDFPNANDVVLSYEIDFSASTNELNRNQTNLGNYLDDALGAGIGDLEPLSLALLNDTTDLASYAAALDQLLPEIYLYSETVSLFAAQDFSNSLFSCSVDGTGATVTEEGQCTWFRASGGALNAQDTFENTGYSNTYGRFSAGVQFELASNWYASFGVEVEQAGLTTDSGANTDSNRLLAGVSLKYQEGPWLFAAAVSGGFAEYDTERSVNIGDFADEATSTHDVTTLTGQLRIAYEAQSDTFYARPSLDVMYTYLDRSGLTETDGEAANLAVSDGSDGYFVIAPKLEIGRKIETAPGEMLHPYASAGITYFANNDHELTTSFVAGPDGISDFKTRAAFDRYYLDLAAGVEVLRNDRANLSLGGQTNISENALQFGLHAKVAFEF
ncbi:MAG: autotransporter domain-containing protein [Pseudomonadota bacterium]